MTVEINDRARKFSIGLQEAMTLGEKGAVTIEKEAVTKLFEAELPEGITMKEVEAVQDASIDFAVGQSDALAAKSIEWMKADESLESTSVSTRVSGNRYDSSYTKKRSGTAMGKPWAKYGTVTTDMVQGSGRRGGMSNVVKYHQDLAESVFSN